MRFAERLKTLLGIGIVDDSVFDDLADLLVEGDLGAALAFRVADELRSSCRAKHIATPLDVKRELKVLLATYCKAATIAPEPGRLCIVLVLGVNGVGKTTTCAKLADFYRRADPGMGIILAACDTFRAAAIDQLKIHGSRLGLRVVAQAHGSDPGAVLWDAIDAARVEEAGLVIADTAGRMHTRHDLMRELGKIDKIIATRSSEAGCVRLLVIDSTTGQNGIRQAETFGSALKIDAVVLSKYDSSAKGGMAIALGKELGLPLAFVGNGESYGDLHSFDRDSFLDDFLGMDS
jgi:fused signal recognition particle receptor